MTHSASTNAQRRLYAGIAAGGSSLPSSTVDDERKDTNRSSRESELDDKEIFGLLYRELYDYFSDSTNIDMVRCLFFSNL